MTHKISQMDLVSAIAKYLEKQCGIKQVTVKQMNAICSAATLIVEKFAEEHKAALPGMGILAWWECDDAGASSKYLLSVMQDRSRWNMQTRYACPQDDADFERCRKMLLAVPWSQRTVTTLDHPLIVAMVSEHPEWKPWIEMLK